MTATRGVIGVPGIVAGVLKPVGMAVVVRLMVVGVLGAKLDVVWGGEGGPAA